LAFRPAQNIKATGPLPRPTESFVRHVFSQPGHPGQKFQPWALESEMGRLREKACRDKIKLDRDAGSHTLRHMFLTEAGDHTDAFTLQYVAEELR